MLTAVFIVIVMRCWFVQPYNSLHFIELSMSQNSATNCLCYGSDRKQMAHSQEFSWQDFIEGLIYWNVAMVKESTRNDEVPVTSSKEKPLPPSGLQRPCRSPVWWKPGRTTHRCSGSRGKRPLTAQRQGRCFVYSGGWWICPLLP